VNDVTADRPSIWATLRAKATSGFSGDVAAFGASGAATAALNLLQGLAVARMLGPERYGVAVLVMSYPSLLLSFADPRSFEVSMRYLGQFAAAGQRGRALAVCRLGYLLDTGVAVLGVALVAFTAAWAEGSIVKTPGTAPLIVVYALSFVPYSLAGTSYALLSTLGRIRLGSTADLTAAVVRTCLVLLLVWAGWGVSGVVYGNAAGLALQGLILTTGAAVAIRRTWGRSWLGGSLADISELRGEIVRFLGLNKLRALIGLATKQADIVLVGFVRGPQEAGLYRVAKSIGAGISYVRSPLQWAAYPRIVRASHVRDGDRLVALLRHLTVKVALPATVLVALAIPFVPFFLDLVVGPAFDPAARAGQLFLSASLGSLLLFWLQALYLSKEGIGTWTVGTAIAGAGSLAAGWLLLSAFGFMGLVVAISMADVLFVAVLFFQARRRYLRPAQAWAEPRPG
jgi:O-antigen/teichoic acid export membrane protein